MKQLSVMPHVRIFLPAEVLQLEIHVHNTQHTFLSWFVGHCLLHVSFLSGTLPEVHQQQKFGFLRKNVSSLKHPSAFSNATCSLVPRPSPSFPLLAALKILSMHCSTEDSFHATGSWVRAWEQALQATRSWVRAWEQGYATRTSICVL